MDRNFGKAAAEGVGAPPPTGAWQFAQALLGKPVANVSAALADARAQREQLQWLARISPERESQLRRSLKEEAGTTREREQLEWLASISTGTKANCGAC